MPPSFMLLLDTSGSMYGRKGEKILCLNQVVINLMESLKAVAPESKLAVITFGGTLDFEDFTVISQITPRAYEARGKSLFAEAVALARASDLGDMITILISDGILNENIIKIKNAVNFSGPLYAIAIGIDADYEQLAQFTKKINQVLPPQAAVDLAGYIFREI